MESNAERNLIDICGKMHDLSERIKMNNQNATTLAIPTVLDMSITILSSLLSRELFTEPIHKDTQEIDEIEEMLKQKEKIFVDQINENVDVIASKVRNLQDRVTTKEEKLVNCLDASKTFRCAEVIKAEAQNQAKIKELQEKFQNEKSLLEEKENSEFVKFEKQLAAHLSEISAKWTEKISIVNHKISSYQKDLQQIIHNKHLQSSNKETLLQQEERRMAREHERISKEFKQRKSSAEQKIKILTEEFFAIQSSIESLNETEKIKYETQERALIENRKLVEESRTQEILELTQKIGALSNEVTNRKLEIDGEKAATNIKVRELEKKYEQRFSFEEAETQRLLEESLQNIEEHYVPKIKKLTVKIEEAQVKRDDALESLRKVQLSDIESSDSQATKLMERNEAERNRLQASLARDKSEYEALLEEKNADINEVKNQMQKELTDALTQLDELQSNHADEISGLMQQFDEQQEKLANMQQQSIEQRDKAKADELMKLNQEHQKRRMEIISSVEKQMQIEEENLLNETEAIENEKHEEEVKTIESEIAEIKNRIDSLNSKMEDIYRLHNSRLEEMMKDQDESLIDDIKKLTEKENQQEESTQNEAENNHNTIEELKKRILSETEEVDRRKKMILSEADDLKNTIGELHKTFEEKMEIIEQQFVLSKNRLQQDTLEMNMKEKQLTHQLNDQKDQIEKLDEEVKTKEGEVTQFASEFDQHKEEFQKETVQSYQMDLDEASIDPSTFEFQLESLKDTLSAHISSLKEELNVATMNSAKLAQLLIVERTQMLEEAEAELRINSEERIKQMKENHQKRIAIITGETNVERSKHQMNLEEKEKRYKEDVYEEDARFDQLMHELNDEKENLVNTSNHLDAQIEELKNRDCPFCYERKAIIKELLVKRDGLKRKLDGLHSKVLQSERKMDSMFPDTRQRTTSSLSPTLPKAKIFLPRKTTLDHKV